MSVPPIYMMPSLGVLVLRAQLRDARLRQVRRRNSDRKDPNFVDELTEKVVVVRIISGAILRTVEKYLLIPVE